MSVQTTIPGGDVLRAIPQNHFVGPSPASNYVAVHAKPAFADILDVLETQRRAGAGEVQPSVVGPKSGLHALYQGLKAAMPQDCPAPEELQHFLRDGRQPSYWSFVLNNASRLPGWQVDDFSTSNATMSQVAMAAIKLQDDLAAAGNAAKFHLVWLKEHSRAEDYGRDTFELVPGTDVSSRQPGDTFVFVVARDFRGDYHRQYSPIIAGARPADGLAQVVAATTTDPYDGFARRTIAGNKIKIEWPANFLPTKLMTLWLAGKLAMDPASMAPFGVATPMPYTDIARCLGVDDVSTIRKKAQHGRVEALANPALAPRLGHAGVPMTVAALAATAAPAPSAAAVIAAPAPVPVPAASIAAARSSAAAARAALPAELVAPPARTGGKRRAAEDDDDDNNEEVRPATRRRIESSASSSEGGENGAACPPPAAITAATIAATAAAAFAANFAFPPPGPFFLDAEEEAKAAAADPAANTAGDALDDVEAEAAAAAAAA